MQILPVAHTKVEDSEVQSDDRTPDGLKLVSRHVTRVFFFQELRESVQLLLTTKIAVYLMTFLIVTVAWAAHIRSLLLLCSVVTAVLVGLGLIAPGVCLSGSFR